jgi:CheY-like chemotaxis protein
MRILIVEDDDLLRESIAAALRGEGHAPIQAIDGLDAWQQLHEGPELPDVIVLDLLLPRMNGQTFRARQLAKPHLAAIPTIVLTVHIVEPQLRAELGAIPIVPKWQPVKDLLAAIDEVSEPPSSTKHCACGRSYDAATWAALPWVGEIDNGREVGERMELRDCPCGSTIARELGRHAISWRP